MLRNVLSLYLFASVIALSIVFVYSFARGKSAFTRVFGLLALSADVYLFGYLLELNVESLQAAMFWNQVQYFGLPFFPALWLLVCLLYTERIKEAKISIGMLVFAIPAITFVMRMTNDLHGLYYSATEMTRVGDIYFLLLGKGPWYYVQTTYILVILVLCAVLYYVKLLRSTQSEKRLFGLLFAASTIPFISVLLMTFDPGGLGIDYTALTLPPAVLLITYALSSFNFLELKVLARERVFEESQDGLVLMDRNYFVKDLNASSVLYFSWLNVHIGHDDLRTALSAHSELLESILDRRQSVFAVKVGGQNRFVSFSTQDIGAKGSQGGVLLTIEDITVGEELTRKLQELAQGDALTRLNNRRHFVEEAEKAVARAERYGEKLSLIMIDIDHFKRVNDTYGHMFGDAVLTAVAGLIQSSFRATDISGRIGGEEFAVVMLNAGAEEAYQKAECFRRHVESTSIEHELGAIPMTVSIGVAELSLQEDSLKTLLARADLEMYKAKQQGRNQTVVSRDGKQ